jgi:hypothetical protein
MLAPDLMTPAKFFQQRRSGERQSVFGAGKAETFLTFIA